MNLNEENTYLQQILNKVLILKMLDYLHNEASNKNLSHADLSRKSGMNSNTFNRNYNNIHDIGLSSFLRYWFAIKNSAANPKDEFFSLDQFLENIENQKILQLICQLQEYDIHLVAGEDLDFIISHLQLYVTRLKQADRLSSDEIETYNKLIEISRGE